MSTEKHANKVSHSRSLNLLLKAFSKKCHRPQRASQFPQPSPLKCALHYILPGPTHISASTPTLCPFHRLIFFSFNVPGGELSEIAPFDPSPLFCCRNIPQIILPPEMCRAKSALTFPPSPRAWSSGGEDDTPAESSINTDAENGAWLPVFFFFFTEVILKLVCLFRSVYFTSRRCLCRSLVGFSAGEMRLGINSEWKGWVVTIKSVTMAPIQLHTNTL